ncbi:hypothetical protein HZC35_04045 [Candidatus Saganbacteria bacterium]|nr:hypothetical protein [Candidatus Saganbacteria bacterium]
MLKGKYYLRNREFLELALPLDTIVRKLLVPFLFIVASAAYFYGLPYPVGILTALLLVFVLVSGGIFYVIDRGLAPAEPAYFVLLTIDCVLTAVTTYFSGGVESFMPIIYGIIGVLAGFTLPLWAVSGVALTAGASYFSELMLERSHLIPHFIIFKEHIPFEAYAHSTYLLVMPLAYFSMFIAVTFIAYSVAEILRKRKASLLELNQQLDMSSKLLVRRDLELNDLNRSLDERVGERTRELQEFHDITVGREIKLEEMESEMNGLLKELGREERYK